MSVRAEYTAKAVNSLETTSRLQEYFTSSGNGTAQESDESDESNNIEE